MSAVQRMLHGVHLVFRLLFVAAIAGLLVLGIQWAMNPDETPGFGFIPATPGALPPEPPARETEPAEAGPNAPVEETPEPTEAPAPEPTEDPAELIAAARPPEETTVQVLDAGSGRGAADQAAAVLRGLGYSVVNVTSSRTDVAATTVWFNEGQEAEARAMRARDARFREVGPNERLHPSINLHVLVGPDWTE